MVHSLITTVFEALKFNILIDYGWELLLPVIAYAQLSDWNFQTFLILTSAKL